MNNYKIQYKQGGYKTSTQGQNPKLMKTLAAKGGYRYENGGLNEAQLLAQQQHQEQQRKQMLLMEQQQQQLHQNYVPPAVVSTSPVFSSGPPVQLPVPPVPVQQPSPPLGQTLMLNGGVRKYAEGGQGTIPQSMYANNQNNSTSSIVYKESNLDKLNEEEKNLEQVKTDESWKNAGVLRKQNKALTSTAMTGLHQGTKFGFDKWAKNKGFENYQAFRDSQKAIKDAAALKDANALKATEQIVGADGVTTTPNAPVTPAEQAELLTNQTGVKATGDAIMGLAAKEAAAKSIAGEGFGNVARQQGKEEVSKILAKHTADIAGEKGAEIVLKETGKKAVEYGAGFGTDQATKMAAQFAKDEAARLALKETGKEVVKTASTEIGKEVVKEGAKEATKGATNLSPYALAANIGGKAISMGADDQDASTWKTGEVAGDLLGDMGEYAGYGSMFGPWGTVIGGGVGLVKGIATGLTDWNKGKEEKATHENEVSEAYASKDVAESETKRYSGFDFGDDMTSKYGGYRMRGGGIRPLMKPRAMSINRY